MGKLLEMKFSKWLRGFIVMTWVVSLSGCSALSHGPLSDEEMRDYFKAHQSDFQALVDVALHDSDNNMIIVLDSPLAGKYRELMKRTGAREVFNAKPKRVGIVSEDWGDKSKGILLGFVWMDKALPEEQTVKNVDDWLKAEQLQKLRDNPLDVRYSPLAEHWYIVLQHLAP
jgi:hypothetical protein